MHCLKIVSCCLCVPLAPKDERGGSTPSQDKTLQSGLPFAITPFIFNMFYDRVQFRRLNHHLPQLPLNGLINIVPKVPFFIGPLARTEKPRLIHRSCGAVIIFCSIKLSQVVTNLQELNITDC